MYESQVAERVTASTEVPDACGAPATFHHRSKRLAERVLGLGAPLFRVRRAWAGDALVLAYHNIVPHGDRAVGETSLHLPQAAFADQLDQLIQTHDVIPLGEITSRSAKGGRPRVVITFDDAYQGAVTAGVRELQERSLAATIFVAPAFVPRGNFWWDVYAGADGELPAAFRDFALNTLAGDDAAVRSWAAGNGKSPNTLPLHATVASEIELLEASRVPGITLGSHTWSHCNLASVSDAKTEHELAASLEWLDTRFGSAARWLSYPYGLCNARTADIARRVGYAGAVHIDGGWTNRSAQSFGLPRLNIPSGLSIDGFRLRAAGLLK